MTQYVRVRRLSETGTKVSAIGWLVLLIACSVPYIQPWPFLAILAWSAAGVFLLQPSSLEMRTILGMTQWAGLIMVWPVAVKKGEKLLECPDEWRRPPVSTTAQPDR